MRFERLEITGFGPLAKTDFDFVPGLNVVYGPNESAKTAIHAALFAGLCGVRRGKGQPAREDKAFQDRHKPWDGGPWEVAAVVELVDRQRIRLQHDLAGRVDCTATDESNGKDLSSSILSDGSIDGSVFLGLNRRAFRTTACIRQAEIVAALADDADHTLDHHALQTALQKAATSAGQKDTSVNAALQTLSKFRTDRVGSKTHGAAQNRPYQAAARRAHERKQALIAAEDAHEAYVRLLAERDDAVKAREAADREVVLAEAVVLADGAAALEARIERASQLQAKHPVQPGGLSGDEELVGKVSSALAVWEGAPSEQSLSGETAEQLRARLEELPERVEGALTPAQAVLTAATELQVARRMQRQELEQPPVEEPPVSHPIGEPTATHGWKRARTPMVAVAILGVAGIAALAFGYPALGAVLLVGAVAAAAATFWFLRPVQPGAAGEPAPARLDPGADRRRRLEELSARVATNEDELRAALEQQGVTLQDGETLEDGVERYKTECAARQAQDEVARSRERLTIAYEQRRQAEERQAARKAAGNAVLAAAANAGLAETDPETAALALKEWRGQHQADLEGQEAATREWAQLQELLGGDTLESLVASAEEARSAADECGAAFSAEELASMSAAEASAKLPALRAALNTAVEHAGRQEQVVAIQAESLKSVAEASAELDEANEHFAIVETLDETLERTIAFLTAAQERVYATIAPALATTVREWLPQVVVAMSGSSVAARYSDVRVDPEALRIEVREGEGSTWRNAELLSAGTREQVYLLLRIALADHLVKPGEIAPLLMDEVTAQADSVRRGALLELILELSKSRQIILFTHDDAVATWAAQRLEPAALRRLEPIGLKAQSSVSV